jgi:hypothetical protein
MSAKGRRGRDGVSPRRVRPYLAVRPSLTESAKMRPGADRDMADFSAISQNGPRAGAGVLLRIHSAAEGAE